MANIRSLWQAYQLLKTGELKVRIDDEGLRKQLLGWKNAPEVDPAMVGEVMETAAMYKELLLEAYEKLPDKDKRCDMEAVNEFLLRVRRDNW